MSLDTTINIVSLESLKTYIEGSTTSSSTIDESYNQLINAASAQFNMWTERVLKLTDYSAEDRDGNGSAIMYLNQFPVSTSGVVVNIDSTWAFSTDTQVASSDVKVNSTDGRVFLYGEIFNTGYQNVRFTYSAGYSSSSMPSDLQRAALEMCQWWWNRESKKDRIGVRSESFEGGSRTFETDMPWSVVKILEHYRSPRYG